MKLKLCAQSGRRVGKVVRAIEPGSIWSKIKPLESGLPLGFMHRWRIHDWTGKPSGVELDFLTEEGLIDRSVW